MRLASKHRQLVKEMEAQGFVWLSHLSPRAQMRFRDRTKRGFKRFIKAEGLTFLPHEFAEYLESTSRSVAQPRIKVSEMNKCLEEKLSQATEVFDILRMHLKVVKPRGLMLVDVDSMTDEQFDRIAGLLETAL